MKTLNTISNVINKIVATFAMALLSVLIVVCVLQVYYRFVVGDSLSWSEELARYCFIWLHLTGASLLCKEHEHATVTAILDLIKGKVRIVWDMVIELVILVDGVVLIIYGVQLVQGTWGNSSPAMSFNMGILNASAPTAGVLLVVQAAVMLIGNVCRLFRADGLEKTKESDNQ